MKEQDIDKENSMGWLKSKTQTKVKNDLAC